MNAHITPRQDVHRADLIIDCYASAADRCHRHCFQVVRLSVRSPLYLVNEWRYFDETGHN